jgi:hypothetical protein
MSQLLFRMKQIFFFCVGIVISFSCNNDRSEYPLGFNMHGPFLKHEYHEWKDSIWLKNTIDSFGLDEFYIAEVSNYSSDTIYLLLVKYSGNIVFKDLCLEYVEIDYLMPRREGSISYYLEEWDTITPHSSKRYLHYADYPYSVCDFIQLSFDVKSAFFDSLNLVSPINYRLAACPMNHPAFLFRVDEGRFIPEKSMDIQKELDRTKREMEKMYKKKKAE